MSFVLITAVSARSLAVCARTAGYRPLVADLFADLDTQANADRFVRVPGSLQRGLTAGGLLPVLERLAAGCTPIGVVVGPGFEDRPNLLATLDSRYGLLGNPPQTVAALKDPVSFARLCRQAGIRHPDVQRERPVGGDWLCKRDGGSGGVHILAARHASPRPGRYYQRRIGGQAISAAFLAACGQIRVLGFSRQWVAPVVRRRFRYGGASRPVALVPEASKALRAAIIRLANLVDLRGLNSADFLVRDDGFDLLEINPRPGATLDIFADPTGTLFKMHLEACAGRISTAELMLPAASAAGFVYAPVDIVIPTGFTWPEWTADRTPPGEHIARTDPICTVISVARDIASAETLLRDRSADLLRQLAIRR